MKIKVYNDIFFIKYALLTPILFYYALVGSVLPPCIRNGTQIQCTPPTSLIPHPRPGLL